MSKPVRFRPRQRKALLSTYFTLSYETTRDGQTVKVRQRLKGVDIEKVGKTVSRLGDEEKVWNIAVYDAVGDDRAGDFRCFQN